MASFLLKIINISSLAFLKCHDMNVVDLGSTQCDTTVSSYRWNFPNSWDGGQNCLPGCISRMNEGTLEEACCQAQQVGEGTKCHVQIQRNLDA